MGILNKKNDQSTELADLRAELAELREYKAHNEKLEQLRSKSAELGYQGDVKELLGEDGDMATAYASLISAFQTQLKGRQEVFAELHSDEDEGDNGADPLAKPVTRQEALNLVAQEHGLQGKQLVYRAREMYPDVFGGK